MEIISLAEQRIVGDSPAIEFRIRPKQPRRTTAVTLGRSEARVLAYALLAAAERAEAKSN